MGRQLWAVYKAIGQEAFKEALKNPVALSWVVEQIKQDREEQGDLIMKVFELLQPWLNTELFVAIDKKKKKEETKIARIAKTDADKVEVLSLFDTVMKNAGIDLSKEEK